MKKILQPFYQFPMALFTRKTFHITEQIMGVRYNHPFSCKINTHTPTSATHVGLPGCDGARHCWYCHDYFVKIIIWCTAVQNKRKTGSLSLTIEVVRRKCDKDPNPYIHCSERTQIWPPPWHATLIDSYRPQDHCRHNTLQYIGVYTIILLLA